MEGALPSLRSDAAQPLEIGRGVVGVGGAAVGVAVLGGGVAVRVGDL